MKRNHIFNITVNNGFSFFAKVTGEYVDEFREWAPNLPGVTKCDEIRAVSPIKGHTSSKTKIAAARMAAGLTQQECADQLGVRIQQYARWERNEHTPKTVDLMRIGEVLGVDWTTLIEERK